MDVRLEDVHDSHGPVFTLEIIEEEGNKRDMAVLESLNKLLAYVAGDGKDNCVLYAYGIELSPHGLVLKLTDGAKRMAKVDNLWNFCREDQKFVTVILEGDKENGDGDMPVRHYECHLCGRDTFGVNRQRMEVYDFGAGCLTEINVHDSCKIEHIKRTTGGKEGAK